MINMPNRFKEALLNDKRNFELTANITLKDHTQLTITNAELWSQGFEVENEVSSNSSFDIGGFIIGRMRLVINNIYEDYTQYDFFDASVDVTLSLRTGNYTDSIAFNDFTVDEPTENASQVILSCLDNAKFFERPYSDSELTYPASLNTIVQNACTVCGVQYAKSTFDGGTFVVQNRPSDEKLTFLKVISWCAQASGNFARINHLGQLVIDWYDVSTFENTTVLPNAISDTESKAIYDTDNAYLQDASATGSDTSNGADWTVVDADASKYHHVVSWGALHTDTDDVVITGVRVVVEDDERVEHVGMYGNTGYVLEIRNNDLISESSVQTIANTVGAKVVGLRFRAYSGNCLGDPTIEAGDLIWITDRKNRNYRSFVCGTTFKLGQYQTLYCGAATPSKNSASQYSESTRAIVRERQKTMKSLTTYEQNAQMLSKLISRGFGMYVTDVTQQDGSVISYMHDRPTIAESSFICYLTSEGVLMESDGTTTAAVDKNGNALLNTLTARGINADWINTGTIRSKNGAVSIDLDHETITLTGFVKATDLGATGATTVDGARITTGIIQDSRNKNYWNLATGDFSLASTATVGGKTVSTIASEAVNAQTQTDIFNKLTNNGQTQGIYLNAQDNKLYINASYINAGILQGGGTPSAPNFKLVMSDGTLTMKKGSINIGDGRFVVSTAGALTANSATIKGTVSSTSGTETMVLSDSMLQGYHGTVSSANLKGYLDLSADYGSNPTTYEAVLGSKHNLYLEFGSTGKIEVTRITGSGASGRNPCGHFNSNGWNGNVVGDVTGSVSGRYSSVNVDSVTANATTTGDLTVTGVLDADFRYVDFGLGYQYDVYLPTTLDENLKPGGWIQFTITQGLLH